MDRENVLKLLKTNNIFSGFSEAQIIIFISSATIRELSPGEVLYTRGEKADGTFCLILSGIFHVLYKDNSIKSIRHSGEVMGEIALFIPQHQRTYTVFAAKHCTILVWEIEQVKTYMPALRRKLFKLIGQRLPSGYKLD